MVLNEDALSRCLVVQLTQPLRLCETPSKSETETALSPHTVRVEENFSQTQQTQTGFHVSRPHSAIALSSSSSAVIEDPCRTWQEYFLQFITDKFVDLHLTNATLADFADFQCQFTD